MEFQASNEEIQECITQHEVIFIPQQEQIDLKISITRKINEQMPANQLRAVQRPSRISPHTFFLEKPLYFLPDVLDTPCVETVSKVKQNRLAHTLKNPSNLPLGKYFCQQQWISIYNKLSSYRQDSQSFSGRFKSLDLLLDYNWKSFKQLQLQIHILGQSREEDSIDSSFQNGNICRVYRSALDNHSKQYHLIIQNDLNTYGYNNWFFFRVRNAEKGVRRFNILNIIKKSTFYQQGMLVSIFSMKKHHFEGVKWFKGGDNLTFGSSQFSRDHHEQQHYYCLSFEYDFQWDSDEVYFAAAQPYTYSRLANLIQQAKKNIKNFDLQIKTLGYSIANNILPLLKFSKPNRKTDEAIVLIGRQHPCETVGSFIIQQIVNQIVKDTDVAGLLLDQFEIYVVPMVNPDGVIHGYSRTNMAGLDLNRQWSDNILKQLAPQSVKIKQYLLALSKIKKIKYAIDFHGHGKKLNSFLFCCKSESNRQNYRLLPFVMKTRQERFNLTSCTYGLSKDKETTLRALTNNIGIIHSYTLQTSLYGWKNEHHQVIHFNEDDYYKIATSMLQSLYIMEGYQEKVEKKFGTNKSKLLSELIPLIETLQRQERFNDNKDNISDSDPEGDRLDVKDLLTKCENKVIKKTIQQSLNLKQKMNFKNNYKSKLSHNSRNNYRETTRVLSFKNVESNAIRRQAIKKQVVKKNNTDGRDNSSMDDYHQFQFDHQDNNSQIKKKENLLHRLKEKYKTTTNTKKQAHSKGESMEIFNLSRPKMRARIRTQTNSTNKKIGTVIRRHTQYSADVIHSKNKQNSHEQNNQSVTQSIPLKHIRSVGEGQLKSSGKKDQTKHLLNDTISVIKVSNNRDKLSELQKPIKNICLTVTRNHNKEAKQLRISNDSGSPILNLSVQEQTSKTKLSKLKIFKQFVVKEGNMFPRRMAKQNSSNYYYYFPVL